MFLLMEMGLSDDMWVAMHNHNYGDSDNHIVVVQQHNDHDHDDDYHHQHHKYHHHEYYTIRAAVVRWDARRCIMS